MSADITPEELLAVMLAGGRLSDGRSNSLPEKYYGDPAEFVKFASEVDRERERILGKKYDKKLPKRS